MKLWKQNLICLAISALFFPPQPLRGQEEKAGGGSLCVVATVLWHDATLYTKHAHAGPFDLNDSDQLLTRTTSFGCVVVRKEHVVIIHSFLEDGDPDDFLVLRLSWVDRIVYMKEVPDAQSNPASGEGRPLDSARHLLSGVHDLGRSVPAVAGSKDSGRKRAP